MKEKYKVTGMTCSACSSRVEKTMSKLDGTKDVSVNLLTGTMTIEYDENKLNTDTIVSSVEKAGYGAFPESEGQSQPKEIASKGAVDDSKKMKKRLVWSVVLLVPLMFISMGHMYLPHDLLMNRPLTLILIQIVLLIPIVALNNKYFRNGIPNLFRGSPNMDSLVAMGASAAIIYGTFAVFQIVYGYESGNMELVHRYSADIYLESAATILTLITVGKYLETMSKGKTSQAIEKLMDLAPKTAIVERNGKEIEVKTSELQIGDVLLIKPGEAIGADGVIIEGTTSIDEATITGESIPVEKQVGDRAVSATINKAGFIKVRCDKTYEDSTINQIIKLVDEASASKAPIARMADKIAGVFVPSVIVIAIVSAIIWLVSGATFEFALSVGIAVLVISCPCALGLATPVAIMVGTGKGAENGILIKSGEALETAYSIDTVIMDKTGTITEGKPKVTDIIPVGVSDVDLVTIAASLEKGSEHPLAEAITNYAKEKNLTPKDTSSFEAIFGMGIKAYIGNFLYYAGNATLMEKEGVEIGNIAEQIDELASQGKTPLIFATEGRLIGVIAVADVEKESSKAAIETFDAMGIDVVMLTGDNSRTAEAIRKRLGISKVIAEVMPADKEMHIAKLQSVGHKVAMIGDGINDGPALVKADVGIAIGAGTDVAIESADAVLMRNDLLDAVTAVKLSRKVIKNIKENLFWAFIYNVIGIPLAAGALYPFFGIKLSPMFGAAAMSLSSLCVCLNALRLKLFKVDKINENVKETEKMKYELKIEGMMCGHCEKHMSDALNAMEGVTAKVSQPEGKAFVESDHEISMDEFKEVVSDAGYKLI